jgi:4-aminobutyrate aminotransferase-like enzyme
VKPDPEERILAAPDDEAELDDANGRGAGAQIEFMREGHAKVTITISRQLVEQAKALNMTTWELFAEAIRLAVPGAFALARPLPPQWH